ncbi:MAG TPA: hypothetical protein VMV46_19495 [Thermoanaerobaculia bacterium]|nr:hypothetical protein [Thermoanaerobaculia bacterium]
MSKQSAHHFDSEGIRLVRVHFVDPARPLEEHRCRDQGEGVQKREGGWLMVHEVLDEDDPERRRASWRLVARVGEVGEVEELQLG